MGVLASVGQGIANLGLPDPRLNPATGRLHDILTDFRRRMETEDSPASRVAPCSLTVLRYLHNILDTDHPREGKFNAHVIDLCIVGFYFMLRPGEFCRGDAENRSSPFRLCDITFTMGNRNLSSSNPRLNDVEESAITTVTLTFTDQKNAVRGEQIAHSRTSDPVYCPVKALYRITRHLRACGVPDDTPIYAFPRSSVQQRYNLLTSRTPCDTQQRPFVHNSASTHSRCRAKVYDLAALQPYCVAVH